MEKVAEPSWTSSYTYQVSKHSAEMLHNLNVQRKDGGRFCDVILRVGEESFPAHKAVLAACSEYFESVFGRQSDGDGDSKELEMHTISPKVFKDILDFAYTSRIVVRLECFPELMTAAKFLLMRSVIEICQEVIKQSNVQILVPTSRGGTVSPAPADGGRGDDGLPGGSPGPGERDGDASERPQTRPPEWTHQTSSRSRETHKCQICSASFATRDRLRSHLACHEEKRAAYMTDHLKKHSEGTQNYCRIYNKVLLLRCFRRWRKQTRAARMEKVGMEKARKHHESQLLFKALTAWNSHHHLCLKYKVMKGQGILLLRLKMCQTYFERWKTKLQHRQREWKQTERALWHWSLTLQAKVLHGWRLRVMEQRREHEQLARAAQVDREVLLREGMTCIPTDAAHRSQNVQRAVRRCAMRWKRRTFCKPCRLREVKGQLPKKSVTFCLPDLRDASAAESGEQEAEDGVLGWLRLARAPRRQPRHLEELFESPKKALSHSSTQKYNDAPQPSELGCPSYKYPAVLPAHYLAPQQSDIISAASPPEPHAPALDSCQTTCTKDLLPPSAFMTAKTATSSSPRDAPVVVEHPSSTHPELHGRAASGETEEENAASDPASSLTEELLNIQLDMKGFLRDRKQLRAWIKMKEVLQSWLQMNNDVDGKEKNAVYERLESLEERIEMLSTELSTRKPAMLLHAQRIQHLQAAHRLSEEKENGCFVFTA